MAVMNNPVRLIAYIKNAAGELDCHDLLACKVFRGLSAVLEYVQKGLGRFELFNSEILAILKISPPSPRL